MSAAAKAQAITDPAQLVEVVMTLQDEQAALLQAQNAAIAAAQVGARKLDAAKQAAAAQLRRGEKFEVTHAGKLYTVEHVGGPRVLLIRPAKPAQRLSLV